MNSIFMRRSDFQEIREGHRAQAQIKIPYKGYEISVCMDDSNGCLPELKRSDIRVFDAKWDDVTESVFQLSNSWTTVAANAESLKLAFARIDALVDATASPQGN